ncbi:MAG TPA: putative DNA modification/repair radical SAM protein [Xanthobacteraceae bacterium]|jgi:putative DNA modification/repair radical SAM protein|nr:putative DNA modification/repair radical SAM protein [Xanthobacteraceae bacterium]
MPLSLVQKLEILADAAKYDVSCASSGAQKRTARSGEIGSAGQAICHAYTPDGRCISLLKILLTNFCIYDCAYCVSRRSSNMARARFSVDEVVRLTLDLYRRNCIEGLFLSSGIARGEDETMADLVRVAKTLRLEHGYRGYLHLKTIPGADERLIAEAGLYADRLSMNIELPSESALKNFAPEKSVTTIKKGLAYTRARIDETGDGAKAARPARTKPPRFAPAGQSTQMIVGADGANDMTILGASAQLYASYALKRVYYSAFSPTQHPSAQLARTATPLIREHRLYQADWLLRFYGFSLADVNAAAPDGMLDHTIDPKLAWALSHRDAFPVDVNTGAREALLRVPGLGTRSVDRIIASRRTGALRLADVARLSAAISRARPFIVTADYHPGRALDAANLRGRLAPRPEQLSLL